MEKISMFCFQCQETAGNKGCSVVGVCGKKATTSNLQDLLIYTAKGIAILRENISLENRKNNRELNSEIDYYLTNALFVTITNANFDDNMIQKEILKGLKIREKVKNQLIQLEIEPKRLKSHDATTFVAETLEEMNKKSLNIGVLSTENEDIRSLREVITYGLKGMAAYYEHAANLGYEKEEIVMFIEKALASTLDDSIGLNELVGLTLETGKYGVDVMALLDSANTGKFGNPEITEVNIGVGKNPGILISGHDLNDIVQLLEQTEGTGVDVYTHSEMLPAHYYPELKKYKHLVGNYGNAWWKQKEEFETFNGPIVFTTNCIVPPKAGSTYEGKVFTTNATGFPGWKRIEEKDGKKDFSEVIELAKSCKAPTEIETGKIVGGFAHNQVFALADKVVDAVKSGAIRRFYVMAGCDGRMKSRDYYTEFAANLPKDTVILTAGCAKYKYNKLNLGDIGGIPRVLDAGQCNDSYSLALIALKLKEAFQLNDINELPIAYNIAWYEQKAVIVLLALLHLGVKNIHLGPTIPAFLSGNVLNVLIENFNIGTISTVEEDLKSL
ncbi:hydroxylamine reductase [Candidatus Cetobacterium colombiensis]|uniref:Hydroxylamine reductase n=1 Tax=Candidatus Cetobacterium colombiensis TaxID=3073100 RepID=A0ABU4W8K7_9FUSO|nr:hydroxylamine reductase [Candidatus Cetobacterium colombiensis]MDX8335848.1 hydroxylamine reductase [Candidatus Cetobacterium colombiensis]